MGAKPSCAHRGLGRVKARIMKYGGDNELSVLLRHPQGLATQRVTAGSIIERTIPASAELATMAD